MIDSYQDSGRLHGDEIQRQKTTIRKQTQRKKTISSRIEGISNVWRANTMVFEPSFGSQMAKL